jgi:hypothetical protein
MLGLDACAGQNKQELIPARLWFGPDCVRLVRPDHLGFTRHLEKVAAAPSVVSSAAPLRSCEGRLWRILLKKSFGDEEQNFIGLLMRFMRDDVRDHVASKKNDHGASYRRYEASQPWRRPKINFCEIFDVVRFSTFSTLSVKSAGMTLNW